MTYEQPTPWSPDVITRFKDLLKDNLTLKEIAAILSRDFNVVITKNACVGKSRRLGAMKRSHWIEPLAPREEPAPRRKQLAVPRRKPVDTPLRRRRPRPGQFRIIELEYHDCRWPTDDTDPLRYCGQRQREGSSYCEEHSQKAWR